MRTEPASLPHPLLSLSPLSVPLSSLSLALICLGRQMGAHHVYSLVCAHS